MRVPPELIGRIRCPVCGERVAVQGDALACPTGHRMRDRGGVIEGDELARRADPDTRRTAASFGYEWTTFDSIQPEDESFWEMYFRDVPIESYRDKVGLDAGCGKGRYSYFTARHMAALAAVDNSAAVDAAAKNLGSLGNVGVFKADLRDLPFAEESFDFVSCLGVLHHLSDPEDGFRRLIHLLRPGGTCLIYVYSRPPGHGLRAAGLAAAARLRDVTVRLPHPVLRSACAPLALGLYVALVVPGRIGHRVGIPALARLPLSVYRGKPVRSLWLDTFDRLSAPSENRYLSEEVEAWYTRAGLRIESVREEAGLFVVGSKPAGRPPIPDVVSPVTAV